MTNLITGSLDECIHRRQKLSLKSFGDDMLDRPFAGTTDWLRCEMIVDVPHEATAIITGAYLKGTGKVWFKDLKIAIRKRNAYRLVNASWSRL